MSGSFVPYERARATSAAIVEIDHVAQGRHLSRMQVGWSRSLFLLDEAEKIEAEWLPK